MRMTRAALRAQAQSEDQPELKHQDYLQSEQGSRPRSSARIHEDPFELEAESKPETDSYTSNASPVRLALRDITDENYPEADLNVEVQSQSLVKLQQEELRQEQDRNLRQSTRQSRGKAKGRTKKKPESPVIVEVARDHASQDPAPLQREILDKPGEQENIVSQEPPLPDTELYTTALDEKTQESGSAVEEAQLLGTTTESPASRTPKFDPAVHIPDDKVSVSEDSFVHSITSRSPAKISLSQPEDTLQPASFSGSLRTHTPLRRTSSTNFEESFEAMDSLEDTIEQITAGLPLLPAEEMHSPDSPVKVDRQRQSLQAGPATPKDRTSRTPRTTSSKLQSILRVQDKDKENTPPVAKTPLTKSKTPLKSKTPTTKEVAPLKNRTPATKKPSPVKPVPASARKTSTNATTKPVAPMQPERTARKSAMPSTAKPQAAARNSTMPPQKRPTAKQPLANTTNIKAESKKPVAPEVRTHHTSMSLNSPAKPQPNVHQRRITSGGVLSTSKPGFIPAKSSKPPTTSTFALPGEAVAEKLKAQKEAREEKMKQPKLTLAEQKAAKLKADREAREERVRLNQLKAKEVEVEKHAKTARPLSTSVLTISKARAEAAERGRQASKEWAEKMMKKKQTDVAPKEGVTST